MVKGPKYSTIRCKSIICDLLIRVFCLFILLHQPMFLLSQAQTLGIPNIESFSKKDYSAGTSNWSMVAMDNGNILAANNSGLLDYNGVNWKLKTLPNRTIARSICLAKSGRVYIGGQDEIGYYKADSIGDLKFISIREQIPDQYLPIEDVWESVSIAKKIYFRSSNKVFIYDEDEGFEVIEPQSPLVSIDVINNQAYYTDTKHGIVSVASQVAMPLRGTPIIGMQIVSILPFSKRELLVLTEQDGAYLITDNIVSKLKKATFEFLRKNRINCAVALSYDQFAIGTQFGGIVIMDQFQDIISIYDKSNHLINNNVRSLVTDEFGSLWAGTNNGISKIDLASRVRVFYPDGDEQNSTYDVALKEDQLFVGSNSGLYTTEISSVGARYMHNGFSKVVGSDGQIWGVNVINDRVLVGHNQGPYIFSDDRLMKVADRPGVWKFISTKQDYLYVGTYTGVDIYKWENNFPVYLKTLEGFAESSRIMISVRENEVWVSHPYRGVYRLTHNESFENVIVEKYSEAAGLPSGLGNYIFDIDGVPTVTSNVGVYSYDRAANIFRENKVYDLIGAKDHNIRRLLDEGYYIGEHEIGHLMFNRVTKDTIKQVYPELKDVFVGGFETMYELDSTHLLVCSDKGMILYNSTRTNHEKMPRVEIHEVRLAKSDNHVLKYGYGEELEDEAQLKSHENAIRFLFNSTDHNIRSQYRFRLLGLDEEWSEWNNKISKEYNNLSHGSYLFEVQTRDMYQRISASSKYGFNIKAPWYLSALAKVFYTLIFISGFLLLYLIPRKKYKSETQELQLAQKQSEEEIEELKTLQLEAEITHKNAQLASSTLHLVQKNETINKIRTEIENVRKKVKDPEAKKELKKVISVLSDDERLEDDWESFSVHFDQVHSDFLKRLKAQYPDLTRKDRKMAAYLRMNLSTKEIAPLLGISVRGVEIGRYRLRKKMDLDTGVKLRQYMVEY